VQVFARAVRVELDRLAAVRWQEAQRTMRPVLVVVLTVDAEHPLKVATAEDEDAVEAVGAEGAYPAFGVGVGVRRLDRRADDLSAEPVPHVVKGSGELAVPVVDQEPDDGGLFIERDEEVAGLLGDPGTGGVGGDAGEMHTPVVKLDEEQNVQPLQEDGVHGEEIAGEDAGRRRNDRHVVDVAARRGAGWRPLARRTLAMVLAETRQPRRSSSPRMRW
jgi:hypothetical protein